MAPDAALGFSRPEMNSKPLAGTLKLYSRHVFLCWQAPEVWPSKVEELPVPGALAKAIAALPAAKSLKLTLCGVGPGDADGDVLVFPEMRRYPRAATTEASAAAFALEVLGGAKPLGGQPLTGGHVFVCCHTARDGRCGFCGPALVEAFAARATGDDDAPPPSGGGRWSVRKCSHVGGHEYAGNVLMFPSGDWYGYVTPSHVKPLLILHSSRGGSAPGPLAHLWRGRIGLSAEEHIARVEAIDAGKERGGPVESGCGGGCTCMGDDAAKKGDTCCMNAGACGCIKASAAAAGTATKMALVTPSWLWRSGYSGAPHLYEILATSFFVGAWLLLLLTPSLPGAVRRGRFGEEL